MAEIVLEGFVVNDYRYNYDDKIITFLTKYRKVSFIAQGVNKILSKNKKALNLGAFSEIEIFLSNKKDKISKLKKANLIKDFVSFSIEKNLLLNFVGDFINKTDFDLGMYEFYDELMTILENNEWNDFILLYVLNKVLYFLGINFKLDSCVSCGKTKGIYSLVFSKGGFFCKNCSEKYKIQKTDLKIMKLFYELNNESIISTFEKYKNFDNEKIFCLKNLLSYYDENVDFASKSLIELKKIILAIK